MSLTKSVIENLFSQYWEKKNDRASWI